LVLALRADVKSWLFSPKLPLIGLFINFPKFDCVRVGCKNLKIFALRSQPFDKTNFFSESLVFKGVKLGYLSLKLEIVLILLVLFGVEVGLEGDKSASPVPQCQISPRVVELQSSQIVFLDEFLAAAFVAEQLRTTVPPRLLTLMIHFIDNDHLEETLF
jgi:hypothetical protein